MKRLLTPLFKVEMSRGQYIFLYFTMTLLLYHWPLFDYVQDNIRLISLDGAEVTLSILLVVYLVTYVLLSLMFLISNQLVKLFCVITTVLNAGFLFFIYSYGVEIDKALIENILNTRYSEASELFNLELMLTLVLLGGLPATALMLVRLGKVNARDTLLKLTKVALIVVPALYIMSGSWLWIDRHASRLGSLLLPWAYIVDFVRFKISDYEANIEHQLLADGYFADRDKMVVVLVIGETARRSNFGLYGYHKNTTPKLQREDLLTLDNTTSCATYTTAGVKCMLSHTDPNSLFSRQYEYLPDYLKRHDVDVIWHTNNWGEPRINVDTYRQAHELKGQCQHPGCEHDEVLLRGLKDRITNSEKQRVFVVLHQKGSHGPLYSTRYPKAFEYFTPACDSLNIRDCSYEELVNAYDNTILYTDHFLSQTIGMLKEIPNTPSIMIYMSDHGESLGEYGLYLHGTPKSIAPAYQFEIPFLIWMDPQLKEKKSVDFNAFSPREAYTQQNVFHTVLGAFSMLSPVYDRQKDVLARPN